MIDPFADPDPYDTFSFTFSKNKNENEQSSPTTTTPPPPQSKSIHIEIRGCKTDSEQVWKSTGLTIWPAAQFLCEYLMNHEYLLQNREQIIELGAGLGLCGIFAHCLTASLSSPCEESNEENNNEETRNSKIRVLVTDGDTDALVQLRENIQRNQTIQQLQPVTQVDHEAVEALSKMLDTQTSAISCHQLLWGHKTATDFVKRHGMCDVVLASDVIYVPDVIPPLFDTVQTLLCGKDGIFLMAYYSRRKVPVSIDLVLEKAQERGFSHECLEETPDGLCLYKFELNHHERKSTESQTL